MKRQWKRQHPSRRWRQAARRAGARPPPPIVADPRWCLASLYEMKWPNFYHCQTPSLATMSGWLHGLAHWSWVASVWRVGPQLTTTTDCSNQRGLVLVLSVRCWLCMCDCTCRVPARGSAGGAGSGLPPTQCPSLTMTVAVCDFSPAPHWLPDGDWKMLKQCPPLAPPTLCTA